MPSLLLLVFLLAATGCAAQDKPMPRGGLPPVSQNKPAPLSPELQAKLTELTSLAASKREEDQKKLAASLTSSQTLDELDEPAVRDRSRPGDLHVAKIISTLAANDSAAAGETLSALAANAGFNSSWLRQELLIRALASRRPLSAGALAFLDSQAKEDSVNLHVAIAALCDNGSREGLELVGRKLADPNIDNVYKIGWMRDSVLRHRREPGMLRAVKQWLEAGRLERELREALVESLFDYRPQEWYPGREGLPKPPDEKRTSPESASILVELAKLVEAGDYTQLLKENAKRTVSLLPGRK